MPILMRKLIATVLLASLLVFSFFQFYNFLKKRIVTSDLKAAAEKRISAFLKVPVHVDRISVGILRHISVSGLQINPTKKGTPIFVGVKKIIVRYDLLSFLKRNFRIPTEIFLDAPHLNWQAFQSPGSIFEIGFLKSDRGILTRFEFEEGEVQLPWFRPNEKLNLTAISGKAIPKKGDAFDIRFKSHVSGAVLGLVSGFGEIDNRKKHYRLEMILDDLAFSSVSQIPISHLNGSVQLEDDTVRIRKVRFLFRGIPCELSGEIQNIFSESPIFLFTLRIREGKVSIRSDVRLNFKEETLSGVIQFADREFRFLGSISGTSTHFTIPHLSINGLYDASGEFDLKQGIYRIDVEHENQRFGVEFFLKNFDWQLVFKLDHFKLFNFDLVTYATAHLKPNEEAWQKGLHIFDMDIKTDYLIFQHQPLRDFRGSGHLSVNGIDRIAAQWGNVSKLEGKVSFGADPQGDLVLRAGPVSLSEFKSFGSHPLSFSLNGTLEGKLEAAGSLNQLDFTGAFNIENGRAGDLKYDRAVINFLGQLPYLVLHDSKIIKGKNSFVLKGGLNFASPNFLESIQVDSSERVVIWKGMELTSQSKDPSSIKGDNNFFSAARSKIEAEYQFGERTSLNVTAEEGQTKKEYLRLV